MRKDNELLSEVERLEAEKKTDSYFIVITIAICVCIGGFYTIFK